MNKEDKQLLLKDLCARLPYGVKLRYVEDLVVKKESHIITLNNIYLEHILNGDADIKPYLRPMSSMTEEEFELLKQYSGLEYDQLDLAEFPNNHKCLDFYLSEIPSYTVILVFDWLNTHHFDYRGLIEMELALEAPEGMYKNV